MASCSCHYLLAIERDAGLAARALRPTPQTELQAGDVLLADVHASAEGINELWDSLKLEPLPLGEIGSYFAGLEITDGPSKGCQ